MTTSARVGAIGLTIATLAALAITAAPANASIPAPDPDTAPGGSGADISGADSSNADSSTTFLRAATYPVFQNRPKGEDPTQETVSEISDVSPDGKTLVYTDAAGKRIGFLDIAKPGAPQGTGTLSLTELGDAEDEPTSVAITGDYVLVVIDTSEKYTNPSGRLDVIRLSDRERVRSIDLGGQPDSIALSADGERGIVAIENQRDEEALPDRAPDGAQEGDLPQRPAGFVQVLDLAGQPSRWAAQPVPFTNADGSSLYPMRRAGVDTPTDPEPEYVSINDRGIAAVTLQENNGVAIVDLANLRVRKVFSAGTATITGVDTEADGRIDQSGTIEDLAREPDSVAWIDSRYVATANEGDWKGGTRGWSIFDSRTGALVWDAGNSFERLAIQHGYYNDSRADKKGAEAEGLAVATMNGRRYAFVGSERANFVAVYDVTRPGSPRYLQLLPTTNGPEGILPIPSRNLLAVSSEVDDAQAGLRASVTLYRLGEGTPQFPTIRSDLDADGTPIGWSALGALSAKPGDPDAIYAAPDNALTPSRIYTVDVTRRPARIVSELPITADGAETAYDIEGIAARPQGGFWLAVEGATGPENELVRTDVSGAVQERVALPTDIAAGLSRFGLEGVTVTKDMRGEQVYAVLQRPLAGENYTRIGRYEVATKTWTWFAYPLEKAATPLDWIGVSEITAVGDDRFAVIERDKLNGPQAKIKRVYTVDLPRIAPDAREVPVLTKRLAIDVLPELRRTNGWAQEKLEGLTIGTNSRVYAVTDNDGVQDATGETVFLDLGDARTLRR